MPDAGRRGAAWRLRHGLTLACVSALTLWLVASSGGSAAAEAPPSPAPPESAPSAPEAAPAPEPAWTLELAVGGGAVLPWAAASELGHAFYGAVGVARGPWRFSLAAGAAAPDSMARATFPVVWAEVAWEVLGRFGPLAPYAIAGAGVALGDGLADPRRGEVRWSRPDAQPLFMLGAGAAFRPRPRGLFVALDLRLFNHTHGGATVSAGVRF